MKNEDKINPKKILQDAYTLAKENRKHKKNEKARMTRGRKVEGQNTPIINDVIRQIRVSKNLTQKEVAERLSISQNGYSKIERGFSVMTLGRVKDIAKALGVDYMEILKEGEKASKNSEDYDPSSEYVNEDLESLRLENLRERKALSKLHAKEKSVLRETIKSKDKVISLLEDKIKMLEEQLKNSSKNQ